MVTSFSKKRRLIAENYYNMIYIISESNKLQGVSSAKI